MGETSAKMFCGTLSKDAFIAVHAKHSDSSGAQRLYVRLKLDGCVDTAYLRRCDIGKGLAAVELLN